MAMVGVDGSSLQRLIDFECRRPPGAAVRCLLPVFGEYLTE